MTLREIQQDFNKNFTKNIGRVTELLSDRSQRTLSYALDLLRPFNISLGLRFSRLGQKHVEVIIPSRSKNKDEHGSIWDAIVIAGATEAGRLLWKHNWPHPQLKVVVSTLEYKKIKTAYGDLTLRGELTDLARESVFSELYGKGSALSINHFLVYDSGEQLAYEVQVTYQLSAQDQLGWK